MEDKFELLVVKFNEENPREEVTINFNTSIDNRIWITLPDGKWYQSSLFEIINLLHTQRTKDMQLFLSDPI